MSPRIAILTPDPGDDAFHTRWRDVLARYQTTLASAGLESVSVGWSDAEDLAGFDLVMPLLAWGYHRAVEHWTARTRALEAEGVRLRNSASVLRWNADKAYLGRLAERGAPGVPTIYTDRVTQEVLADAAAAFGTGALVAKPRISATAWQTIRWSPGSPLEGGPDGAALVQPYLPNIEESGEVSLIFFEGGFSHAIRKRPQPGDFRVQPEYDGIITAHEPAADEREAAQAALAAAGEDLLYARVDLVRGPDGKPVLMELELVEPDLYLGFDPAAGARFADAVGRAARA